MTAKLAILSIIELLGANASATAYCSSPSAPYCAARYGAFDDHDEFDRCKLQMSSYQSEAQDYLSCLRREADTAIEDYNGAVDSFNRRARR
jgi:hypothetical protein